MKRDDRQIVCRRLILLLPVACVLICGAVASRPQAIDQDRLNKAVGLSTSQLADIRVDDQSETYFLLSMTLEDEFLTMFLMPRSIRSEKFEVWIQDPSGELRRMVNRRRRGLFAARSSSGPEASSSDLLSTAV